MNEKIKKLGSNTLWMLIGNFSTKVLTFLLVPLYTYVLSTREYGIIDLIITSVSLLSPILTLSVTEGIIRLMFDNQCDNKQIFSVSVYVSLMGFAILCSGYPIVFKFSSQEKVYMLFLLYYFSYVFLNIAQQFAKGNNNVNVYVVSGIISTIITCILNIIFLLLMKLAVVGYLMSMILGSTFGIIYIMYKEKLWEYILPINKLDKKVFYIMMSYCIPLIPNSISWWISNSSDKYLLSFFVGVSVNGVYSVAYKIPSIITIISGILTSAWQISAIEEYENEQSSEFFSKVYNNYLSVYILLCSFIILFIKIIAKILFVGVFFSAWKYSIILVFASLFQSMGVFLGIMYSVYKKTKVILYTTLLGAVTNIILNVILIPTFGATGAAFATLVSFVIVWGYRVIDSSKFVNFENNIFKELISYLLICIQICVTYFSVPLYYVVSLVIFFALIYIHKNLLISIRTIILKK